MLQNSLAASSPLPSSVQGQLAGKITYIDLFE